MQKDKKLSVLVVGQGLAGSILADRLINRGVDVQLIDKEEMSNSSNIAAGIINPITGRRFVLSWMIDDLIQSAIPYYEYCEQKFNITFLVKRLISRTLHNAQEMNNWEGRASLPAYAKYILEDVEIENQELKFNTISELGHIDGFQVNVPELVAHFRSYFLSHDLLTPANFDANEMIFEGDQISYHQQWFDQVVFCEGWAGQNNPFFNYLPFNPAKGEILLARVPGLHLDRIYKDGIFIAPLKNDLYWIGASNQWNPLDQKPSAEKKKELIDKLERILKLPFEIVEHKAAIRPTVKDRRPFLGKHPELSNLFIFNGLGTKGASIAPYWSKVMADLLIDQKELPHEVDIQRFAFYLLKSR